MREIPARTGADAETLRDAVIRQAQLIRALELSLAASVLREKASRDSLGALEDILAEFGRNGSDPAVGRAMVMAVEVATTRRDAARKES